MYNKNNKIKKQSKLEVLVLGGLVLASGVVIIPQRAFADSNRVVNSISLSNINDSSEKMNLNFKDFANEDGKPFLTISQNDDYFELRLNFTAPKNGEVIHLDKNTSKIINSLKGTKLSENEELKLVYNEYSIDLVDNNGTVISSCRTYYNQNSTSIPFYIDNYFYMNSDTFNLVKSMDLPVFSDYEYAPDGTFKFKGLSNNLDRADNEHELWRVIGVPGGKCIEINDTFDKNYKFGYRVLSNINGAIHLPSNDSYSSLDLKANCENSKEDMTEELKNLNLPVYFNGKYIGESSNYFSKEGHEIPPINKFENEMNKPGSEYYTTNSEHSWYGLNDNFANSIKDYTYTKILTKDDIGKEIKFNASEENPIYVGSSTEAVKPITGLITTCKKFNDALVVEVDKNDIQQYYPIIDEDTGKAVFIIADLSRDDEGNKINDRYTLEYKENLKTYNELSKKLPVYVDRWNSVYSKLNPEDLSNQSDISKSDYVFDTEDVPGGVMITGVTTKTKDIVIPSEINGKKVVEIGSEAFTNGYHVQYLGETEKLNINDKMQKKEIFDLIERGNVNKSEVASIGESVQNLMKNSENTFTEEDFETLQKFVDSLPKELTEFTPDGTCRLTSVVIPDTVKKINSFAFKDNDLKSVTIPESVIYIGEGAFSKNELKTVTVPKNCYVGQNAFLQSKGENIVINKK